MSSLPSSESDAIDDAPPPSLWDGLKRRAGVIATVAIFLLALLTMQHMLRDFHYHQIILQLKSLSARQILIAILCTAASYWTLTFYDLSALRYARIKLPYKLVAFASFTGYAVSNNVGFALISGGGVRYRLYSAAGVSAGDIAKIIVFAGVTFTAGLCAIGSFAFLIAPGELAPVAHISPPVASAIGGVALALILATLVTAAINRHPIRLWRLRIAIPSARMVAAQILISGVDIALAAATLYIVLPPLAGIGYWGFLGLFSVALLLGVISNVPGGIGVFESVMLIGLRQGDGAAVLGGIIAYRAIYFLLPLILAGILLAINEVFLRKPGRLAQLKGVGTAGSRLVPPFMAALVFIAGVILLISGAAPETDWRLELLEGVVPLSVMEVSHILGSLIGLALLILARGLYRRLDSAWYVSGVALATAAVISLIKGLDYEEAAIMAIVLAVLIPCRREFYRRARVGDLRISFGWLLAIAGVLGGIVWITIFTTKHVEYSNELWWQFAFSENAPRSLRATFLIVLLVVVFGLSHLFRPTRVRPHPPTEGEIDAVRGIVPSQAARPDANVVYLRDKALLFNDARTAFIMYAVRGESWVALGDPVGPPEEMPELIWRFRELCDRVGGRPAFYEVSSENLPHYLDVGLTPIKVGEEARVKLAEFSLDQPGRKDLRYSVRRAERDGLVFEVVPKSAVAGLLDQLKPISDAWLQTRNAAEKRFSVGAFDPAYIREFDVAVVRVNGRITAFANIWKALATRQAAVDIMRFEPGSSPYTMEYLFAKLLLWAKDQGFEWMGLGMAPLSGLASRDLAPVWQRLGALVFQAGERFYNFRGLRLFKDKFKPVWEPRYMVCQGGFTPFRIFSDTAALIAGGLRGVWLK
jgi:phosphatidylglycerol lysyltransferase